MTYTIKKEIEISNITEIAGMISYKNNSVMFFTSDGPQCCSKWQYGMQH